tara:strand:- start:458 stop:1513 length:1056 start_codon:yes stop_codon:yes gene_type:complete
MAITKQDIMKMIKEELKQVLFEDLSLLRDMTPGDVLEYMRKELNGKIWFFWDLETIGFDGQITQYGAIAYKIEDIDGPIPTKPLARFDVNVALNEETLEKHISEQDIINRADKIFNDFQKFGERTRELDFLLKVQEKQKEGSPFTVADMIGYTNYVTRPDDRTEVEAMEEFLAWIKALGPNVVSVGHNIKSFDRNKIIKEGEALGIDTTAFQQIDIFDTVNFQRQVFKQIAEYQMQQGDPRMARFFDEKEKEIKGEVKKIMTFNGKLQRMMDVYGPGPDYVQLHTAVDDTKQLITAFFNMYKEVKDLITTNEKIRNLTSRIDVSRAQKELGTKDIKDPIEISKALKRTKRG